MRKIETPPKMDENKLIALGVDLFVNEKSRSALNSINERYLYWDKVKHLKIEGNESPLVLWGALKLSRSMHAKTVKFGKYRFKYNLTDFIQKELHGFDLHIGGNLGTGSIIPEDDKKRYLISSIMEEAIASSQIEGAVTTRKKAKEMLRKNLRPKNSSEQMIMNNFLTIKHILDVQHEDITKAKLLEIHKLVSSQTLEDKQDEGQFRNDNEINVVDAIDGEVVHIPPDHNEVEGLMEELFYFFNNIDNEQFVHPIVKGCIIHFMIGFIHPFVDGNGRTARALFYWYLLKNGYWLTEYLSISRLIVKSKTQYAKAFIYCEIDNNDLTYFINYKMKTMRLAYDSLREYIQHKISEKKQLINFQKIDGINERQALIIKWIYEEPELLLSVKEVQNRFNVANQTARTDLFSLEQRDYLQIVHLNKKTVAFFKSSSFDSLLKNEMPLAKNRN